MGGSKAVESERADDGSNDAGDRDGVVEVEPPQQKKKPTSPPASPPNGDASAANPKKNSKDVGDAGVPPPPGTAAAHQDDSTSEAVKAKDAPADSTPAPSEETASAAEAKDVDGGVSVKKEGTSSKTAKDKEDVNASPSKAEESPKEVKCQACLGPTHGHRFRLIPCDHVICASCFGKMHALSTACCPVGSCGRDATGHIVEEVTSEADTDVVAVKKLPPQMYEKRPLQPLRRDVDAVVTVTSRAASGGGGAGGPSAASPSGTTTPGKFQTKTFALSRGSKDDELVSLCVLLHPYVVKGNSLANTTVPPGGRPNLLDRCIAALAGLDRTQQRQQPPMPVPVLPPLAFAHPKGYPPPAALYPPMPHPAMAMHPGVMPMPPLQPPHPPPPHQQQPPGARMGVPPTTVASTAATQPGRGRAEGGGKRTLEVSRKERKNAQARSRAAKTREVMDDLRRRPREELTPEELKVLDAFEERRRKKNDRSKEREAERKAEIERIRAIPERRRTAEERETLDTFMRVKLRKNEGDRLRRARIKSEVEGGGRNEVPV